MIHLIEFISELFGEIAIHSGYWRFFLSFVVGLAIAGLVWWQMPEGRLASAIAVGTILVMTVLGIVWERSAK